MSQPRRVAKVFTSNGTWTCPAGVKFVTVYGYDGAGGGGGGGGGGGAGGTHLGPPNFSGGSGQGGGGGAAGTTRPVTPVPLNVTPNTNYAITVGAGGSGGAGGPGGSGGSFAPTDGSDGTDGTAGNPGSISSFASRVIFGSVRTDTFATQGGPGGPGGTRGDAGGSASGSGDGGAGFALGQGAPGVRVPFLAQSFVYVEDNLSSAGYLVGRGLNGGQGNQSFGFNSPGNNSENVSPSASERTWNNYPSTPPYTQGQGGSVNDFSIAAAGGGAGGPGGYAVAKTPDHNGATTYQTPGAGGTGGGYSGVFSPTGASSGGAASGTASRGVGGAGGGGGGGGGSGDANNFSGGSPGAAGGAGGTGGGGLVVVEWVE